MSWPTPYEDLQLLPEKVKRQVSMWAIIDGSSHCTPFPCFSAYTAYHRYRIPPLTQRLSPATVEE